MFREALANDASKRSLAQALVDLQPCLTPGPGQCSKPLSCLATPLPRGPEPLESCQLNTRVANTWVSHPVPWLAPAFTGPEGFLC